MWDEHLWGFRYSTYAIGIKRDIQYRLRGRVVKGVGHLDHV